MAASARGSLRIVGSVLVTAALTACGSGLVPRTPRVAHAPGYELSLGEVRGGTGLRLEEDRLIEVHVAAIPARSRVLSAAVQQVGQPPCSGGMAATEVHVPGDPWTRKRRPKPGQTLRIALSGAAWKLASQSASRLDLLVRDGEGAHTCIAFPLLDAAPENRWLPLESWTLSGFFQLELFLDPLDGIDSAGSFGLSLGKWLGPVRLNLGAGGGAALCGDSVCPRTANGLANEHYYVPTFAGVDSTLFQVSTFALELGARYGLAFTGAETLAGERKSLLHGPALVPRISWTLPDPLAPGVPGGPRRGYAVSFDVPLGYVMSSGGDRAFSVGAGLVCSFPVH